MVKELCIIRHGMAETSHGQENDFERKLTSSGRGRISRLAHLLKTREFEFDLALYSNAVRCKETFDILQSYDLIRKAIPKPSIYQASHPTLLQLIYGLDESLERVLLVGHNPGVSQLVGYLSGDLSLMLSPGMVVHLRFEGLEWKELSKKSGMVIEVFQ
ncbi:SixA phosphatase family protein [Pleomorphovibrio marinus]|uniref:SixA phosphatase family protein n=1 Tax=Pleomorphovibrio marinus TaxID=2164132 RepID=UPI000E0B0100|nr:histidine phosphatase family protein [Pleomorphovibrio marinus]